MRLWGELSQEERQQQILNKLDKGKTYAIIEGAGRLSPKELDFLFSEGWELITYDNYGWAHYIFKRRNKQ